MQKRMSDLLQSFEHLKFEQCLRMSDQILKKIQKSDNKKKNTMNDHDLQIMYLTRIGSLAATGNLHQANQLINKKFQTAIVSQQQSFLFLQICSMVFDKRIPIHVNTIIQTTDKNKKNIDINRFILLSRKFSYLSRIFLKKYATQKKYPDAFSQVYLQYLQQLQNQSMITYTRDRIIHQNKKLDFKFISMFLQKYITSYKTSQIHKQHKQSKQQNNHKKILKSIIDIKLKISIHQSKIQQIHKIFKQNTQQIKDNIFIYLRSLIKLQNQKQLNFILWKQQYMKIFRNNLNLNTYQPIYDYCIEFIQQFVQSTGFILSQLQQPKKITYEQLYNYKYNNNNNNNNKQDIKQQIQNYLNSLYTQYIILKQKQKQYKNKDFYKIAVKNCLLLLINILNQSKQYKLLQQFLLKYKQDNGKKLTFPDQIWKYYQNKNNIFTQQFCQKYKQKPQKIDNYQDKLIWDINYQRLFAKNPLKFTYQQNLQQWNRLHILYQTNLTVIQKQKKLQKGQRYLSDQFLTIFADSIRIYLQQQQQQSQITQTIRQQLSYLALFHLQPAIQKSPHNHDLKLRTLYYFNKLNYHEQSLKILQSLDIKAVQFQTLGYFHFKNICNFCTWDSNQYLLIKIIRSYQQTLKQSIQYSYKALIATSFNQCQQNICYYQNIERSYNLLLFLYIMYMKNKGKQNCQFYLNYIIQRIKQYRNGKLSFNADFKIMKNVINPINQTYVDFYGIYNNFNVLENQCKIKLLIGLLVSGGTQEQIQELRKNINPISQLKKVYDFSEYNIFDKKIQYKFTEEKVHHERITGVQLNLANKTNSLALDICNFIISIRKQGLMNQQIYQSLNVSIKQLNQLLTSLPWRQQTLFLPQIRFKISEIISALSAQVQAYSSKKKKAQGQAQKKQACQDLILALINCVTDGIKLQDRVQVQKKYIRQICVHRDELLERVTKMTSGQFKKFYKIK